MAIHRTYIGRTPTTGIIGIMDIIVEGVPAPLVTTPPAPASEIVSPVGRSIRPVGGATISPRVNAPPGWIGGDDGWYYEWRGRPIRFEQRARLPNGSPNPAFVPRLRLGWKAVIMGLGEEPDEPEPADDLIWNVSASESLVGEITIYDPAGMATPVTFPDPPYGPVLRVFSQTGQGVQQSGLFVLHMDIFEQRDEDRNPTAGP